MKLKRLLIVAVCVGLASAGWVLAAEAAAGPEETEREKEYTGPEQMPTEPAMSWADQIKNPTPWMTWGYDLRMREIYANNFTTLDAEGFDARGHERQFQRIRSRLWSTFTPMEDVEIDTRLVWEWRNWCGSTDAGMVSGPESIEWDEAIFDHLNFSLKNLLGEGSKLTVGRQDVIFGNGWLVLDGTPLDGSRTIFFDAARLTMPVDEENKVDLVWI